MMTKGTYDKRMRLNHLLGGKWFFIFLLFPVARLHIPLFQSNTKVNHVQRRVKSLRLRRAWLYGCASLAVLVGLTGCAAVNKEARDMQNNEGYRTTRVSDRLPRSETREDDRRINNQYDLDRGAQTNDNNMARGVRVADDIAREISDLKEVDTAYVLMMGRRAYVAVMLENQASQRQLTSQLKNKIANRAKAVDPLVQRVYVSTNPDFVKQMKGYTEDIRAGRPITGMVNRIGDLIRRTFPEAK